MALISSRTAGCPVCGAAHHECTPPGYQPDVIEMEVATVSDDETKKPEKLEHYVIEQDNGVEATYKLNATDAKRMGAKRRPAPDVDGPAAGGKVRTAPNK